MRSIRWLWVLAMMAACGSTSSTDGGPPPDAGDPADAGLPDAGHDAGTMPGDAGAAGRFWDGGSCAVKTDCPCFSSDDCGPGFTCHSEDSSGLNVFCVPGARGTGALGAACTSEADCQSALCVYSSSAVMLCSVLCDTVADCGNGLPKCTYVGFGVDRSLCSPP